MKTQHTPGPWVADRLTCKGHTDGLYYWHIQNEEGTGDTMLTTALVPSNYSAAGDDPEAEANARLIAAAPELLAELMEQVEVIYSIRCHHQTLAVSTNFESDQKFHRNLAERLTAYESRARAAVAKATA